MSVERLRNVAQHAILNGYGEVLPWTNLDGSHEHGPDGLPRFHKVVRLRLNMDCEEPYPFELVARWSADHSIRGQIVAIWGLARCRQCFACKRRKSLFWTGRAVTEFQNSARTIMGTFTLTPEKHQEFDWRLEVGSAERPPVDLYRMSESDRFAARASIFGDEITKWVKRLRRGQDIPLAGGHWRPKLRYLLIAEAHDSEATSDLMKGRPHFHILLHEQDAGALVMGSTARAMLHGRSYEWERRNVKTRHGWKPMLFANDDAWIRQQWEHGFTKFQLAEDVNSAVYVCKYLTKQLRVRVRASQHYGGVEGEQCRREGGAPLSMNVMNKGKKREVS